MLDLINLYTTLPHAKLTFATKCVNRQMLDYDPQGKTRIRFSLMPQHMSKLVDVRITPTSDRIAVMQSFREAGYEVNVSFAPVIYYEGWLEDWVKLFDEMNQVLDEVTKKQLTTEIIFLTHNEQLHDMNMLCLSLFLPFNNFMKNMFWKVWLAPVVIGIFTSVGLLSALTGDGVYDAVSWLTLGFPVILACRFLFKKRRQNHKERSYTTQRR